MRKVGCKTLLLVAVVAAFASAPTLTFGFADSCNARADFLYLSPANYYQVGDIVRVQIQLGSGIIQGGTQVTINRVRFELDCTALGVPCPDAGNLISYVGNITSTCSVPVLLGGGSVLWTANSAGGTLPNEVVFTATPGLVVPANTPFLCDLQFDLQVNALPIGTSISQAAGFGIPNNDAVCNTAGSLAAGNQSTGQLNICNCDDGDACTNDVCDPSLGCQHTPITCNDGDACTTDTCIPATGCVYTPNAPCNDGDACTTDTCNPATGCVYTPNPPCNDNDACTTDTCNPATGCVYTPNPPCNDNNACTADTCDPAIGCVYTALPPCDDSNACTTDTCDPAVGCVYTAISCDDQDLCTIDIVRPGDGLPAQRHHLR